MSRVIDGMEYLPVAAVAQQLATTELKILMLLKQKVLSGDLVDGAWLVTADSVAGYHPGQEEQGQDLSCRSSCKSAVCGCH